MNNLICNLNVLKLKNLKQKWKLISDIWLHALINY